MNSTTDTVTGVVEAVGTKFNGSLKVNGQWYSNKKGFANPAKQGDNVTVTLEEWEFKGKTGKNIFGVIIDNTPVAENKPQAEKAKTVTKSDKSADRDFNAENRGKVRHGLTVALVPLVATESITVERLKEVVNGLVEFVMVGK